MGIYCMAIRMNFCKDSKLIKIKIQSFRFGLNLNAVHSHMLSFSQSSVELVSEECFFLIFT